ncbi:hypothetical protein H5410_048300 [Solanum commersonii]|uniref:Uncharacterized protein n=1 Tax=Solanum commersonii TaxID=4109 RepID=A0A9J5XJH2_SOLCO|nr:hypothetical protein H5410_048300 [Solanum commersonii]
MSGCIEHNTIFEEILLLFSGKPLKNLPLNGVQWCLAQIVEPSNPNDLLEFETISIHIGRDSNVHNIVSPFTALVKIEE